MFVFVSNILASNLIRVIYVEQSVNSIPKTVATFPGYLKYKQEESSAFRKSQISKDSSMAQNVASNDQIGSFIPKTVATFPSYLKYKQEESAAFRKSASQIATTSSPVPLRGSIDDVLSSAAVRFTH